MLIPATYSTTFPYCLKKGWHPPMINVSTVLEKQCFKPHKPIVIPTKLYDFPSCNVLLAELYKVLIILNTNLLSLKKLY